MAERDYDLARQIVSIVLPRVVEKGSAITYGNLSKAIKTKYGRDVNPHVGFNDALAIILKTCSDLGLPCLSVMIVNQGWKPGVGFVPYYKTVHPEAADLSDAEIRRTEEHAVKECTDWSPLLKQFGIRAEELGSVFLSTSYLEGGKVLKERIVAETKRIPTLRAQCLAERGTCCFVCGLDSTEKYGIDGIVEVHHLRPLADGNERETDPAKDLVPVCPTCHVALHSKPGVDACYSINELREKLGLPPRDDA